MKVQFLMRSFIYSYQTNSLEKSIHLPFFYDLSCLTKCLTLGMPQGLTDSTILYRVVMQEEVIIIHNRYQLNLHQNISSTVFSKSQNKDNLIHYFRG